MNDYIRKCGAGGYTLVEVLIVIAIIAILAGGTMLTISRGSDNAEAAVIMSDLDAAKNALLAYSMEHRTRTSDRLEEFIGANSSVINGSLDNYMSSQISMANSKAKARFDKIAVDTASGKIRIGFKEFPAEKGLIKALERKTSAAQNNAVNYQVTPDYTNSDCTILLDVK
jgi:prepilin-type N-terminal cleavage/methylation domain-containing protein